MKEARQIDSFFVGITIPIFFFLVVAIVFISPHLVTPPDISKLALHFVEGARNGCTPKPLEQFQYLVAAFSTPILLLCAFLGFSKLSKSKFGQFLSSKRVEIGTQIVLSLGILVALFYQQTQVFPYFDSVQIGGAFLLTCSLAVWIQKKGIQQFLRMVSPAAKTRSVGSRSKSFQVYIPIVIAMGLSIYALLPGMAGEQSMMISNSIMTFHLPYYLGEFFSTNSNRIPYVNFYPMYENVMAFILAPVFKIFGYRVSVFTFSMSSFSWMGLMLVFASIFKILRSYWRALLFYVPIVAGALYSLPEPGSPHVANTFGYFADWPIRLFGPCILFFLVTRYYLTGQSRVARNWAYVVGSVVAINNIDFGLPAFFAMTASLCLWDVFKGKKLNAEPLLKNIGLCILALFGAVSAYGLLIYALSGHFPDTSTIANYMLIYGKYGYGMMPAPKTGLYWIVYLVFMLSIMKSLTLILKYPSPTDIQKARSAGLMFIGIFGGATMLYFMGRSHPYTLILFLFLFAIALFLLIQDFLENLDLRKSTQWIPAFWYAFSYFLLSSILFFQSPNPIAEVKRLAIHFPDLGSTHLEMRNFLGRYLKEGDKVAILVPYGDIIARDLHVQNTLAVSHPLSIFLVKQVDLVMKAIEETKTDFVFGEVSIEMSKKLKDSNFARRTQVGNLEFWQRAMQ